MSPFCLAWLLPQLFIVMALVLESLGLHRGEIDICVKSTGRRKTNQPIESHRSLWKPRHSTERNEPHNKKFGRFKLMLTPGFIKSMGQIQTQEKQEVSPLRPNLNLDTIFKLFRSKYNFFSHSWIKKPVTVVTFNIALDPAFHSAAVPQARFLGLGTKMRACWLLFIIRRREEGKAGY